MDSLNTVAAVVTLLSAALSLYFYRRSQRLKAPAIVYDVTTIQVKTHPEITIMYRGEEIANLTRVRLAYWNRGRAAIRRDDVPEGAQPRVIAPDARVVSISVIASSTPHIDFKADLSNVREVAMDFKYLNFGDGAVVEILYDTPALPLKLSFEATLVDGESLAVRRYVRSRPLFFGITYATSGIVMLALQSLILGRTDWSRFKPGGFTPLLLIQLLLVLLTLYLLFIGIKELRERAENALPLFAKSFFDSRGET